MPELPEVETIARDLVAGGLLDSWVTRTWVGWERSVGGSAAQFMNAVAGMRIMAVERRGKFLILAGSESISIVAHMRMSGRLFLEPVHGDARPYRAVATVDRRHARVVLGLSSTPNTTPNRELIFIDPRKFGRFVATEDPGPYLDTLGIEPLSAAFGADALRRLVGHRRMRIKPLLLDQRVIAGLGNIYTDEALWTARIHPEQSAATLSRCEVSELAAAIREVLERGVKNLGTRLGAGASNFVFPGRAAQAHNQEELRVFQRTGLECPRCGDTVQRISVAQRSTHICPSCQRLR